MAKPVTQRHTLTDRECIELLLRHGLQSTPSDSALIKLMRECFQRGLDVDIMHTQARKK